MDCCLMSNLERYLRRFDEILNQKANQMLCRTSISDVTIDFCECMIPHHEGEICMCKNCLQCCIDPRLKTICEKIIKEQTEGVIQLRQVRCLLANC